MNKQQAQKILRKKWKNIQIKDLNKFSKGYTEHDNYHIITENPSKDLVLRLKGKKKHLNVEYKAQKLLTKTDVPVPKIYLKDLKNMCSVIEFKKGKHLDEFIKSLSQEQIENLAYELGNYTAEIHSIRNDKYGQLTKDKSYGVYDNFYDYYMWRINGVINDIKSEKGKAKFIEYVEKHKHLLKFKKKASLTHYDLYPDNILATSDHITGIFDWEGARWSDNELDLVKFYWWTFSLSKHIEKAFFKAYTKKIKLSPNFNKKLEFYKTIEATAYAVWARIIRDPSLIREFVPLVKEFVDD